MANKKQIANGQGYKVSRLLSHPDKMIGEAENLLARLFRIYLADSNIGPELYIRLVTNWINNPRYGFSKNPSVRSYARGNLNKEILRPNMSSSVFLKAMSVMDIEDLEICMRVKQRGRDEFTEHTLEINDLPGVVSNLITYSSGAEDDKATDDGTTEGEPTGYRRQKKGPSANGPDKP